MELSPELRAQLTDKFVVYVAGEMLSGKATFADLLSQISSYKTKTLVYSDILKDILKILAQPRERINFQKLSLALRVPFGDTYLEHALFSRVAECSEPVIILDGARNPGDIQLFPLLPNKALVYVTAPLEERFERQENRQDQKAQEVLSWEEFKARNNDPAEANIHKLGALADFTIHNTGSLEDYQSAVADFYHTYIQGFRN